MSFLKKKKDRNEKIFNGLTTLPAAYVANLSLALST